MPITWETVSTPNTTSESIIDILCVGAQKFVAVGTTGTVLTSSDAGETWVARTAAENNTWTALAYDGTTIVAVAASGANRVMTSTDDGETWTAHAAAAANVWVSVTYADFLGLFVAVSLDGANRVMVSSDSGSSWTAHAAATVAP